MISDDELNYMSDVITDLVLLVRERLSQGPAGAGPELRYHREPESARWSATAHVMSTGADRPLTATGQSAMGALGRLRAALEEMVEGKRPIGGGEV